MRLSVNVDHIATLRQARRGNEPDPVAGALLVEMAGVDGVIVHLREDRRHIQDRDLRLLRQMVKTHLNMEMAPTEEMASIAQEVGPDMVTLVPEKREELTTEGGLDVAEKAHSLPPILKAIRERNIVISLFIDPQPQQIKAAAKLDADFVELHTGRYAGAEDTAAELEELERLEEMATMAHKLGLGVGAGHGLNYRNVRGVAQIEVVEELNIGFSIIARALFVGLERAVREMKELVS